MKALFNQRTDLVGWMSDDRKNIFDPNLNWVAFIASDDSVWSTNSKTWIGNAYGYNIRDVDGRTAFWNPETPIENSLKPLRPLKPLNPLTPLRPLKPLNPLRPLKPLNPLGGWSRLTWENFIK